MAVEEGEAIWPTRARPRTDSRIVGSLGDGVEVTRPASLKILMRGAPVFLLHRHARVCLPSDSWAARLLGRLGSEGGGAQGRAGTSPHYGLSPVTRLKLSKTRFPAERKISAYGWVD